MGIGIVQVIAQSGYQVVVTETFKTALENAPKRLSKSWDKMVSKGKITQEDAAGYLANISFNGTIDALKDCDLVIEAVPEKMDLKKSLFKQMDEICSPDTILASNTSALSITEISAATKRPNKVMGTHFFNPVPSMKLVELISAQDTDPATVDTVEEFMKSLKKRPVRVKETPGFLVNRILMPYLNEAFFAYQEGLASAEDIDEAMKLGAGMPMGPLALADMVGLDVCLMVAETLYTEFGDPKYRPAPILRQMVRAGKLGVKTGRGFYDYTKKA